MSATVLALYHDPQATSARARHDDLLGQAKRALDDTAKDKADVEVMVETLEKELTEAKKNAKNAVIEEKRLARQLKKIVYNCDAAK